MPRNSESIQEAEVIFYPDISYWEFYSNGVALSVKPISRDRTYHTKGPGYNSDIKISKGEFIGQAHFIPFGTRVNNEQIYDRSNLVSSMIKLFNGIFQIIYTIDQKKFPGADIFTEPGIIIGATNDRIAHFSKRLGFQIIDEIDNSNRYLCLAATRDIKEKFFNLYIKSNIKKHTS